VSQRPFHISSLTMMLFGLSALLDTGNCDDISIGDVKHHAAQGDLIPFLYQQADFKFDMGFAESVLNIVDATSASDRSCARNVGLSETWRGSLAHCTNERLRNTFGRPERRFDDLCSGSYFGHKWPMVSGLPAEPIGFSPHFLSSRQLLPQVALLQRNVTAPAAAMKHRLSSRNGYDSQLFPAGIHFQRRSLERYCARQTVTGRARLSSFG
jgi:hypothetical protein